MIVTLKDICEAAKAVKGKIVDTPCSYSRSLSKLTKANVIIKFENLQFTGSFKERGALVKLLSLTPDQRDNGVITMSAGNHAQAVAYHAQQLGISALIVMPRFTPNVKVEQTRAFNADVILHGEGLDEASEFAQKLAKERNLHLVHPYDDKKVITGQGTIALEVLAVAHPINQETIRSIEVPASGRNPARIRRFELAEVVRRRLHQRVDGIPSMEPHEVAISTLHDERHQLQRHAGSQRPEDLLHRDPLGLDPKP